METEVKIIAELMKVIREIKKTNLQTQKHLLLESHNTNKLYADILHELRRQNAILDDRKIVEVRR